MVFVQANDVEARIHLPAELVGERMAVFQGVTGFHQLAGDLRMI